jgi:hypothetical protein
MKDDVVRKQLAKAQKGLTSAPTPNPNASPTPRVRKGVDAKEQKMKVESEVRRKYNSKRSQVTLVQETEKEITVKKSNWAPEGKKYANSFDLDRTSNDRTSPEELSCTKESLLGADRCCDRKSKKIVYGLQQDRPAVPWCALSDTSGDAKEVSAWRHGPS